MSNQIINGWKNGMVHDFGKVMPNQTLKHDFEYIGDRKIKNVNPACNCTATRTINNIVKVETTPKKHQKLSKTIKVVFVDGHIDTLRVTADVGKIINVTELKNM